MTAGRAPGLHDSRVLPVTSCFFAPPSHTERREEEALAGFRGSRVVGIPALPVPSLQTEASQAKVHTGRCTEAIRPGERRVCPGAVSPPEACVPKDSCCVLAEPPWARQSAEAAQELRAVQLQPGRSRGRRGWTAS